MRNTVKASVVRIGNSRGIRIPKVWLDKVGLTDKAEMAIEAGRLVIRPVRCPREGWEEQFKAMAACGEDRLLEPETPTEWDRTEWEW